MGNLTSRDSSDWEYDCELEFSIPTSSQPDEEPFDFALLPRDLQYKIVENFGYQQYALFEQTSRLASDVCNEKNYSLPHFVPMVTVNKRTTKVSVVYDYYDTHLPNIPWHIASRSPARLSTDSVKIACRATSGRIQAVSKLFEKNRIKAEVLTLSEHIVFKPEDLNRLLKAASIRHIDCRQFLARDFFKSPGLQNMSSMTLSSTGCTDDELVKLKVDGMLYMVNDFVSARGLNKLLRQWKRREREINMIDIEFDSSFGNRNFNSILDGLDANPIWTPEMHEDSMVAQIKIDDFYPMKSGDPEHLYSIFRPDEPENNRVIRLSMGRFEVFGSQSESEFLLSYLNEDQYYELRHECMLCEMRFCYHRGKYSMARLKKHFPRIYSAIIHGFMALGIVYGSARLLHYISGERPFTRHFPSFLFETPNQEESRFSRFFTFLRVQLLDYA